MTRFIQLIEPGAGDQKGERFSLQPLVTVADFAGFIGTSEQFVRDCIHDGTLPGVRIQKRLYVLRDEFIEKLKRGDFDA